MKEIKWIAPGEDISAAVKIRVAVFCDEQGYSVEQELDEIDPTAWHLLVLESGVPVATGRLFFTEPEVIALGRVAVGKSARGNGTGFYAMEAMIDKAKDLQAKKLWLDAQSRVVGFYEKLGFAVCGEEHMDGHVPHKPMERKI